MKLQVVFAKRTNLLFVGLLILALAGCSRCEECKLQGITEALCETEFDSPDQFENAVADKEADGAICTSTGGF